MGSESAQAFGILFGLSHPKAEVPQKTMALSPAVGLVGKKILLTISSCAPAWTWKINA